MNSVDYSEQREQMVLKQLKPRGIEDERVLDAFRRVERHMFVPKEYQKEAYADSPLPIGFDQTISQPYIVAYMVQALQLKPEDRVLEIGTGSGYQTAILAQLCKEVYTIEVVLDLITDAQITLQELNYHNIHYRFGDGYQGWPEAAPFHAIIGACCPPELPHKLLGQLKDQGYMLFPIEQAEGEQELILITKQPRGFEQEALLPVRFFPMVKKKK